MEEPDKQIPDDSSFVIAAIIIVFPVFILFRYMGKVDFALPTCICLGGALLAVRMRWDLTDRVWFWTTIAFVLLLQVPVVLFVPFPHMIVNRITLLPIGFADFLIVIGAIRLVEAVIIKFAPPDAES